MTNTKVDPTNNAPSAKKLGKRELDKVSGGWRVAPDPDGKGGGKGGTLCSCVPGTSATNVAVYNLG